VSYSVFALDFEHLVFGIVSDFGASLCISHNESQVFKIKGVIYGKARR
jgi:hypothetical protein